MAEDYRRQPYGYMETRFKRPLAAIKHFADGTALFTIGQDPNTAATDMNHNLELIKKWAHDLRMSFNPDARKQRVEVMFSRINKAVDHPVIVFDNTLVMVVDEHLVLHSYQRSYL